MKIDNKYLRSLSTSLLCTLVVGTIMVLFLWFSNNADEERLADRLLSDIPAQLDKESAKRRDLVKKYDDELFADLATIKFLLESGGVDNVFSHLCPDTQSYTVYLVHSNGLVSNSSISGSKGKYLTDLAPLSPDDCHRLLSGDGNAVSSVCSDSNGTLFKGYATSFGSSRLVLVTHLKGKYASVYSLEDLEGLFGPVDERLFVAPIDNATLKIGILRVENGDFSNRPISDINLDESATQRPSSGHTSAFGYGYHYKTVQYKSNELGDYTILAFYTDYGAIPPGPLILLLVTIFIVTFLVRLYCLFIDEEPGRLQLRAANLCKLRFFGLSLDSDKARSILPFALLCVVIVTLSSFYFHSIYMVANQSWTSRWNIAQVSECLGKLEKISSDNFQAETEGITDFMNTSSDILYQRQNSLLAPSDISCLKKVFDADGTDRIVQVRNPWLADLARINRAHDISIFDAHGRLLVTSGSQTNIAFSRNDSSSAPAFDIIDGVATSRQFIDDNFLVVCVPFALRGSDALSDAILAVRYPEQCFHDKSIIASITTTFDAASESGHCLYVMTSASDDHNVIYAAESLKSAGFALPNTAFCDGYLGFHHVDNTNFFVATKRIKGHKDDYFIFSFVPVADVFIGRTSSTLSIFFITLLTLCLLLAHLLLYSPATASRLLTQANNEMELRRSLSSVQLEKMNVDIKKSPSASQRILGTIRLVWLAVLCFATGVLIVGLSAPNDTFAGYLMSFSWQRGINVFSVSSMFIIVLSFAFILSILSRLMSVLGKALNPSVETACQLLVSLLRYAGYIVALFVTLYMFGVDTTGVLASLGAFSVMVGLGAQSLIKDVLAGISIIMEKDYRVGDIVEINGFCGKVDEIGIRTTKVEDIDGNIKIFYNSNVSGVVNMTRHLSAVRLELKVDANHSFDSIEQTLNDFFAIIEGKYPQIKGKCTYLGIQDSAPSFNVFLFSVPCDEIDRVPLRRSLLKDLSEFCMSANIVKL